MQIHHHRSHRLPGPEGLFTFRLFPSLLSYTLPPSPLEKNPKPQIPLHKKFLIQAWMKCGRIL